MLIRALGDTYIRRPLARLRSPGKGGNTVLVLTNSVNVNGEDIFIVSVMTKFAQPELMSTIGTYNIVKFDGVYYGVPHGAAVDWESGELAAIPGMLVGKNVADLVSEIDSLSNSSVPEKVSSEPSKPLATEVVLSKAPILLGTMEHEGYNIVLYEGWVYGMPHDLGPIDLTRVDVIEMPGVIRDVSRDAVESEVISRSVQTSLAV
jgi:hypothetical protein